MNRKLPLNVIDKCIIMIIEFNRLVEGCLKVIETVIKNNFSKEETDEFLGTVRIFI